jgi:hypothetical protein
MGSPVQLPVYGAHITANSAYGSEIMDDEKNALSTEETEDTEGHDKTPTGIFKPNHGSGREEDIETRDEVEGHGKGPTGIFVPKP